MRVSSACPVLFSISLLTPIDHLKISERRGKINFLSSFKKKNKNLFLRRKRGFFLFFFFQVELEDIGQENKLIQKAIELYE